MKPFTELMDIVLSPLKSAAIHGAANLAANIGTTVQLCITLYIILFGWQIARGEISEPWNDFAKRAVKLGLIVAVLQSPALYKEYVIDFLAETLPDALSNAMSGNPVPDANKFDTLAAKFGILLTQIWQGTGWSAPAATARAAVVTLLVMPFVWGALIAGFVVTLWAKAGMYFVATLGPLFIALAMFEQTRRYLNNWLDQIVTMIALQVLVAMTCGLVLEGLERAVKDAPTPENVFALAGKVIVLTVFSLAIWSSLPRLASKLGGYGASVAGAGSRAAPMDAMRAPLSSFSEHGGAPAGRPELASIAARSGDPQPPAPIMPSPIVAPNRNSADRDATDRHDPSRSSAAYGTSDQTSSRRATQGVAELWQSPASASARIPTSGSGVAFNNEDHRQSVTSAPASPDQTETAATSPGTRSESADFSRAQHIDALAGDAADSRKSGPSSDAFGRADRQAPTMAGADDEALIEAQRTGFEGMDFEHTAPRVADAALATIPIAPVAIYRSDPDPTTIADPVAQKAPSPRRSS